MRLPGVAGSPTDEGLAYRFNMRGMDPTMNNITVDGSYFNNSFGLGGQPGDRTGVAPISLEAIEQVQVSVAPFDVRAAFEDVLDLVVPAATEKGIELVLRVAPGTPTTWIGDAIRVKQLLLNLAGNAIDACGASGGLVEIEATIFVERDSQKGIVIGKGGGILKEVGTEARADIALIHARQERIVEDFYDIGEALLRLQVLLQAPHHLVEGDAQVK